MKECWSEIIARLLRTLQQVRKRNWDFTAQQVRKKIEIIEQLSTTKKEKPKGWKDPKNVPDELPDLSCQF